ncbi:hypothetical protein HNR03_005793 [Pseudomonas sp. JAI111]|nr:hypothetical protein [Pseudomonas sp. JAI111]
MGAIKAPWVVRRLYVYLATFSGKWQSVDVYLF